MHPRNNTKPKTLGLDEMISKLGINSPGLPWLMDDTHQMKGSLTVDVVTRLVLGSPSRDIAEQQLDTVELASSAHFNDANKGGHFESIECAYGSLPKKGKGILCSFDYLHLPRIS